MKLSRRLESVGRLVVFDGGGDGGVDSVRGVILAPFLPGRPAPDSQRHLEGCT